MGFGGTAKKIQKLATVAEKTYAKLNELRDEVEELRATVRDTGDRVETLESEVAAQRALLEAIATEHDVDVEGLRDEGADAGAAASDGAQSADATETSASEG